MTRVGSVIEENARILFFSLPFSFFFFTFIHVAESGDLARTFQEGNCPPCCHFRERSILGKQRLRCGRTMSNVSRMRHHIDHMSLLLFYVYTYIVLQVPASFLSLLCDGGITGVNDDYGWIYVAALDAQF